jgi:peptidylamidoglycolate lyase
MLTRSLILVSALAAMGLTLGFAGPKATPPGYQVVHGWPQQPEGFVFGQVSGLGVDSHNHVFVFHRSVHPIMIFDGPTGKMLRFFGDGVFGTPHGLTVDHQDNIWVTDIAHQQVFKFSNDGKLLMTLGTKDVRGNDGTHFSGPTDIAVLPNGDFYVSDGYGNSRVAKFSADGKFQLAWGKKGSGQGEFDIPHGISLDKQGRVYVADRANSRVQIFDPNGKFITQWQSADLGRPWDIAVGSDGYAYIADGGQTDLKKPPDRGRVLKLDLQGHILAVWGRVGKYDGQFCWAHQLAVSPTGDVYVGDVGYGMRAQKFVASHGQ